MSPHPVPKLRVFICCFVLCLVMGHWRSQKEKYPKSDTELWLCLGKGSWPLCAHPLPLVGPISHHTPHHNWISHIHYRKCMWKQYLNTSYGPQWQDAVIGEQFAQFPLCSSHMQLSPPNLSSFPPHVGGAVCPTWFLFPRKTAWNNAHLYKSADCICRAKDKIRSIIPSCHFSIYKPNKYNK